MRKAEILSIPSGVVAALLASAPVPAAAEVPPAPAVEPARPEDANPAVQPAAPVPAAAETPAPAAAAAEQAPARPESEIVVTAHGNGSPGDPLEAVNVQTYEVIQAVDENLVGPIAHVYMDTAPKPFQDGLHHFLNNLDEPIVFLNFLLQLKPGKALETAARFAINTTIGLGGVMDIAAKKPFKLPRRSNGLADTMGYYGIGPGPYLFVPGIGSTTVRDLAGRLVDFTLVPLAIKVPYRDPTFATAKTVASGLDERAQIDEDLTCLKQADDPYTAIKTWYLKKREIEIAVLRGKPVEPYTPCPPATAQAPAASPAAAPAETSAPMDPVTPVPAAIPADIPQPAPQP